MTKPSSSLKAYLVLGVFALVVVAAIAFIRSRSTERLSIEDKVNMSALANRICKAAAANGCPIEWNGRGRGSATIPPQAGKPLASLEQVRTVLVKPQWAESEVQGNWSFSSGKYQVTLAQTGGAIVISSL